MMSKTWIGMGVATSVLQASTAARVARQEAARMTAPGVPIYNYKYRHLQTSEDFGIQEVGVYDWVLKLQDGFDAEQLHALCGADCQFEGHQGGVPLATMRGSERKLESVLSRAAHMVEFVEPDTPVILEEPEQDEQEVVLAQSSTEPWGHPAIGLPGAQHTGKGVTVYVTDTGVRVTHDDFGGRAVPTIDTFRKKGKVTECDPEDATCAGDTRGHGTHVAGTVGGTKFGIAKEATIAAMKVCCGSGSNIYAGMDWIAMNHQKPAIMTMSLGSYSTPRSAEVAVDAVVASGVLVTVSAGNADYDSCDKSYTFIASAFGVGAANYTYTRASFSNWGDCVQLFAPGVSILSAYHGSDTGAVRKSGTSMAAPAVAGAAALLLEASPTLSVNQVKARLLIRSKKGAMSDLKGEPNRLLWVSDE